MTAEAMLMGGKKTIADGVKVAIIKDPISETLDQ